MYPFDPESYQPHHNIMERFSKTKLMTQYHPNIVTPISQITLHEKTTQTHCNEHPTCLYQASNIYDQMVLLILVTVLQAVA